MGCDWRLGDGVRRIDSDALINCSFSRLEELSRTDTFHSFSDIVIVGLIDIAQRHGEQLTHNAA